MKISSSVLIAIGLAVSAVAHAQSVDRSQVQEAPIPPKPTSAQGAGVKLDSGIGSTNAYARAGVVELGGSFTSTSAQDFLSLGLSPSVGWFLGDNFELSLIGKWSYAKVKGKDADHVGSLLFEPSYVLPLNNTNFVFVGVGIGGLYELNKKTGVAVAPRIGYKTLVGRSALMTIDFQPVYSLNDTDVQSSDQTVLTVKNAYNVDIGFTVLL